MRHNASDTIQASYGYTYDGGDNMLTKTEPWVDDFSDGVVADDGLAASGPLSVVNGAARNTGSAWATLYRTINDDDTEFRFTYSIDAYTAADPYVYAYFRYNLANGQRLAVQFKPSKAELRYYNGSSWTTYSNTSATTTLGTKYKVRVEADGARVRVWRSPAGGGAEVLLFDRTDAPLYDVSRLAWAITQDTSASLDDVMILAGDAGLSRTATMTYRANNEIDTVTDYNGAASYTFDAWGRTSTEAKNGVTRTYSWMSANLLQGINSSDPNETDVAYNYTGDLKRVWRFENSALTNAYQWDAGFNVTNEFSNVNPMKTFVPGLAEVSGNAPATSATYNEVTTDHLGSTRGMWNTSATQTGSWEFTPYGAPYNFAGPSDVTQLYTGHDLDRMTGQSYAVFRTLNPSVGRWLSQDPIGMIDGTNMFAYARNRPNHMTDPLGLACGPGGFFDDFPILDRMGFGADFGLACRKHDSCYAGKNYITGPLRKDECDLRFLNDLRQACDEHSWFEPACRGLAKAYHWAVQKFGDGPYNEGNEPEKGPRWPGGPGQTGCEGDVGFGYV